MRKQRSPQTLGGTIFWRDRMVVDDHRIQQHVRFGRVRVLDPDGCRIHTGTSFAAARNAFDKAVGTSRQRGTHMVVLLHGYGGRPSRMTPLSDALRDAGFVTEVVQYPSLCRSVDELAANVVALTLASARRHRSIKQVSFCAFSFGGLVASSVMRQLSTTRGAPALGSLVAVGAPFLGSRLANIARWLSFIGGPSLADLVTRSRRDLEALPVPVGVVASRGVRSGWTVLGLLDDGDGVVGFDSAVGVDAADELVLHRVKHTRLPARPEVVAGVVSFLEMGRFK